VNARTDVREVVTAEPSARRSLGITRATGRWTPQGARRVFVHASEPDVGPEESRFRLALALRFNGFLEKRSIRFGRAVVDVWRRA
jgi:hypothetical protein